MSSDYAALLRRDATVTATVPQPYMNTLSIIRVLIRNERLTPADKLAEIAAVLDALATVQEELDAGEGR